MRFIDGKGVAERVARVALLRARVFAQELFCGNLRRAAYESLPGTVSGQVSASLNLARKRFACKFESLFGAMHDGPRDFLAGLPGRPPVDGQRNPLVLEFGLMQQVEAARCDFFHRKRGVMGSIQTVLDSAEYSTESCSSVPQPNGPPCDGPYRMARDSPVNSHELIFCKFAGVVRGRLGG